MKTMWAGILAQCKKWTLHRQESDVQESDAEDAPWDGIERRGWDGIERRGKPKAILDFANHQEVLETLMAAVASAKADGHNKLAERDRWHNVGDYVLNAAQSAEAMIRSINPELSTTDYAMACRAALAQAAERFVDDPSDAASFYGATLHGIIRSIEVG